MNNVDWLAHRAKISPKKAALIEGDHSWTYHALNNLVADIAASLAAAGVKADQHVAVLMPNRVEYVGLIHALARMGACVSTAQRSVDGP